MPSYEYAIKLRFPSVFHAWYCN